MIDTREIFDDIHESISVQQYGKEQRREGKFEGVPSLINLGFSVQQITDASKLPINLIHDIQRRR